MKLHPAGSFDNHAKRYDRITVEPFAAAMGAEILGVQVRDIDDATFAEIEDALFRHGMIVFRDQTMSLGEQERFTLRFVAGWEKKSESLARTLERSLTAARR